MISGEYREIDKQRALDEPHVDAWRDSSIPAQQLELTDAELLRWTAGETIAPFDALRACMQSLSPSTVLEVGCGVGHNADVVRASGEFVYTGVDYSDEFIRVAKNRRKWFDFAVMDALLLDYRDRQFDVVISGCCLLHIVNWRMALSETARVARKFVVLHRTPITQSETAYYFKKAYGVQVVEIHFNEAEIRSEMKQLGFAMHAKHFISTNNVTYLFRRSPI